MREVRRGQVQPLEEIVRSPLDDDWALNQLVPTEAVTRNQLLPAARTALVHDVPTTPVASEVKPELDEVVER